MVDIQVNDIEPFHFLLPPATRTCDASAALNPPNP